MSVHPSWWLGGAAACAVLAGTIHLASAALGPPESPAEIERTRRLNEDERRIFSRWALCRSLAEGLAEGRLTLAEAAAALRRENETAPRHLDMHVEYLPGKTDDERYRHCAYYHVAAYLEGDPRAGAALARLEAELRAGPGATSRP